MPRTARTAANVCNLNDIIFIQKRAIIHQTTQLKHLGLCTVACIPEPVNDVDKLKQRLIGWLRAADRCRRGDWRTKKNFLGL